MRTLKINSLFGLIVSAFLLFITFSSCNNANKAKKAKIDAEAKAAIQQEIKNYTYPLPSVFEVTNMLNKIEARYIIDICNDAKKSDFYLTEKQQAENLGIYTADLAYAITYNQKEQVKNYFKACESLVQKLDFTSAFDRSMPDRIENNMDNKDSLVSIITEMVENTYSYLNQHGKQKVSYLTLTGTAIEGLYLTTHISDNTFQNPEIIKAILFQKEPLLKMQKLIEPIKNDNDLKGAYNSIKKINSIYALEEGNSSMTQKQIEQLTKTVSDLRDEWIK
ncbi:MAG: hypothetical protein JJE45_06885 [Prolixibacteraceae bacterium]|nr:hypothetical protein [Prolixibacteraceae bacterium]